LCYKDALEDVSAEVHTQDIIKTATGEKVILEVDKTKISNKASSSCQLTQVELDSITYYVTDNVGNELTMPLKDMIYVVEKDGKLVLEVKQDNFVDTLGGSRDFKVAAKSQYEQTLFLYDVKIEPIECDEMNYY